MLDRLDRKEVRGITGAEIEGQQEADRATAALTTLRLRQSRDEANRWLAQFAPLLDDLDRLTAEECRERLEHVPELRAEGERVRAELEQLATPAEAPLLDAFRAAQEELEALERDYRRRLGLLAPGDAAGEVDLVRLRERLAEAAARRELESAVGSSVALPASLELKVSPGSRGSAAFMGLFSAGIFAFTSIHATLFIGGFMRAIGPLAFGFLAFYAIFWAAAYGMARSAVRAASQEEVAVEQRHLRLRRRFGPWEWEEQYTLAPESRASVTTAVRQRGNNTVTMTEVALQDAEGRDIRFACGRSELEQQRLVTRLNEYLGARR